MKKQCKIIHSISSFDIYWVYLSSNSVSFVFPVFYAGGEIIIRFTTGRKTSCDEYSGQDQGDCTVLIMDSLVLMGPCIFYVKVLSDFLPGKKFHG
jgi:hypothetical protein